MDTDSGAGTLVAKEYRVQDLGRSVVYLPLALVAGVSLAACRDEQPDFGGPLEGQAEAIVGGEVAVADQFPEVALIYNRASGRVCTGTLIAADAVVTAAHCVVGAGSGLAGAASNAAGPDAIEAYFDTIDMRRPGSAAVTRALAIHPQFVDTATTPQFDVALIELQTPLADRRTAAILFEQAAVGETYLQVGFGRTDPAKQASYGTLHFYAEASTSCTPYQLSEQSFICFREDDGDGVCDGDSGGPIFREEGGKHALVGTVAFGRGDSCRELGVGAQLTASHAFLQQQLGSRLACAQNGICDATCDDIGALDMDCQTCETPADCKAGDFCIAGDCVPPKNADLPAAASGGMALRNGCQAAPESSTSTRATAHLVMGSLAALWLAMRRPRGKRRASS